MDTTILTNTTQYITIFYTVLTFIVKIDNALQYAAIHDQKKKQHNVV